VPPGLPKSEVIAFASASLFFKTFQIHRAVDAEKNVLVYTVVSTKLKQHQRGAGGRAVVWLLGQTNTTNWRRCIAEQRIGGIWWPRAREAANYRSRTSGRTDLALAARQLAHDIPQVVRHLLTLLRRKCLCELLDRPAPKRLDLRHQPRELVLILRFFGISHALYMATDGVCSNQVIGNIFKPRPYRLLAPAAVRALAVRQR